MTGRRWWLVPVALVLAACAATGAGRETVVVSAAASLTDVLTDLSVEFEADQPGYQVVLNLGASSALREQILSGAAADVFLPASPGDMVAVARAGLLATPPQTVARTHLVLAVPAGNPGKVTGLEDLADPDLLVGICSSGVPCGDLARVALRSAGVTPSLDTEEPDVRALLTKIAAGELDVGIVYATDLGAAEGEVEGIALPEEYDRTAVYQVALLAAAPQPEGGGALIELILSSRGEEILRRHGFRAP